jgi:hypothetical protein
MKSNLLKNLLSTSPIKEFVYQCCNFQLLVLYIPYMQTLTLSLKTLMLLLPQQRKKLLTSNSLINTHCFLYLGIC